MTTTPLSTTAFSLRDIVADICQTRREADPGLLVDPVMDAIDPADYEEALRQALHGYITTFVVTARHTPREAQTGRKIGTSRLSGVAAFLTSREFSPARGEWIHLADANAEDLRSMAAKREAMAAQYTEKANWYFSMANALSVNSAATVADLPALVQKVLLEARPA